MVMANQVAKDEVKATLGSLIEQVSSPKQPQLTT